MTIDADHDRDEPVLPEGAADMRPARRPATGWRHFQHGADVGICGWGATVEQAFEQAAVGLTAVIAEPQGIAEHCAVEVRCEAPDLELLFVDWLNSLVFEMVTRKLLLCRFTVQIEGCRLHGRAWGEPVDVARHQPAVEVKGATYTELSVSETETGWQACCVVDV